MPRDVPETRKRVTTITNSNRSFTLKESFSNYNRLIKCVAYFFRFIEFITSPSKNNFNKRLLHPQDFDEARIKIVRFVQKEAFSNEFSHLKASGEVSKKSKLLSLSPFLDQNNIIRVGGRIKNSNLCFDVKHPVLLPKHHHFTKLIIQHFHTQHLHARAQATLAAIRQQYWIISSRRAIRQVLHKCIPCFRVKPTISFQKIGNLPDQRLNPGRPFQKSGIDYCGPINIKEGCGRGRRTVKAYIALFICLCTKAVHLPSKQLNCKRLFKSI